MQQLFEADLQQPIAKSAPQPSTLALVAMTQIQGVAEFAEQEELLQIARRMMQMAEDLRFAASAEAAAQPRRRLAFTLMTQVQALAALAGEDELNCIAWRAMQTANTVAHIATKAGAHRLHLAEQLAELCREQDRQSREQDRQTLPEAA